MHTTPYAGLQRVGWGTFFAFTMLVVAACGRSSGPELILTNATIVTPDASPPGVNTIAIGGGRILALTDGVDPE